MVKRILFTFFILFSICNFAYAVELDSNDDNYIDDDLLPTELTRDSELATTLLDYVLSSSLTTTLSDYVLASALTTTLGDYVLTSALSTATVQTATELAPIKESGVAGFFELFEEDTTNELVWGWRGPSDLSVNISNMPPDAAGSVGQALVISNVQTSQTLESGKTGTLVTYTNTTVVPTDDGYGAGWDGDTTEIPSKDDIYDKVELILSEVRSSISETTTISEPDQQADDIIIKHFDARAYPYGVTMIGYTITASSAMSDTHVLEEWDDRSGSTQTTSESITMSATQRQEDDGTLSDSSFAADSYLVLNLDDSTDDVDYMEVTYIYQINQGE